MALLSLPPADFFCCAGAQKAGTTTLHALLAQQPAFVLPNVKETKFFVDDEEHGHGADWYLRTYFPQVEPGVIRGEVDPDCLFFTKSASRIAGCFPGARIIVLLRNPIDRAYSHYLMGRRRGIEPLSFRAALEAEPERLASKDRRTRGRYSYVARGRYAGQIQAFAARFPDSVHIELFSEFVARPMEVLARIQAFLGAPAPPPTLILRAENVRAQARSRVLGRLLEGHSRARSAVRRIDVLARAARPLLRGLRRLNMRRFDQPPAMPDDARSLLVGLFEEEVARLSDVIGQDFRPWLQGREPAFEGGIRL